DQFRRVGSIRVSRSQPPELAPLPRAIGRRPPQRVVGAKRQHVEKPPGPDPPDLARNPLPHPPARLADDHRTRERRKRPNPPRQSLPIEIGSLVTNQQRPHRYQHSPLYSAGTSDP